MLEREALRLIAMRTFGVLDIVGALKQLPVIRTGSENGTEMEAAG